MFRIGLVGCLLVLLVAAGCAGAGPPHNAGLPRFPRALAQQWASEASNVAVAAEAGDGCRAQQLARSLNEQVAARSGRIPSRFRTPLLSAVAALVGRTECVHIEKPTGPPEHGKGPKDHKRPKGPKRPKKGGPPHVPGGGPGDRGGDG